MKCRNSLLTITNLKIKNIKNKIQFKAKMVKHNKKKEINEPRVIVNQ